jgi:hypothetical protein
MWEWWASEARADVVCGGRSGAVVGDGPGEGEVTVTRLHEPRVARVLLNSSETARGIETDWPVRNT